MNGIFSYFYILKTHHSTQWRAQQLNNGYSKLAISTIIHLFLTFIANYNFEYQWLEIPFGPAPGSTASYSSTIEQILCSTRYSSNGPRCCFHPAPRPLGTCRSPVCSNLLAASSQRSFSHMPATFSALLIRLVRSWLPGAAVVRHRATSVPCHFLEPQLLPLARLLTPDHALALLRLLPCSSGSWPWGAAKHQIQPPRT